MAPNNKRLTYFRMTIPSNSLFLALMLLICWWVEFVHEGVRSSIRGRTLPPSPETRWCVAPIPRVNLPTEIGGCYFGVRSRRVVPNAKRALAEVPGLLSSRRLGASNPPLPHTFPTHDLSAGVANPVESGPQACRSRPLLNEKGLIAHHVTVTEALHHAAGSEFPSNWTPLIFHPLSSWII